jgi:hypothetical protein
MAERGLPWIPRGVKSRRNRSRNSKNVITITELEETELTISQKDSDIQLTELIETKLVILDQTRRNKDNIRKNHFRNSNRNVVSALESKSVPKSELTWVQNTVIIVVTEIIDARDSSNQNTRYLTHQVQSNEEIEEQELIVVGESVAITIDGRVGSRVRRASPTGTGSVAPSIATYNPNAAPNVDNNSLLLPSGVPAPNFGNCQVGQDPAIIIQENQAVFVEFVATS